MKALSGNDELKFNHVIMVMSESLSFSKVTEIKEWCSDNCTGMFFTTKCSSDAIIGCAAKNNGQTPFGDLVLKPTIQTLPDSKNNFYLVLFEYQEDAVLFKSSFG